MKARPGFERNEGRTRELTRSREFLRERETRLTVKDGDEEEQESCSSAHQPRRKHGHPSGVSLVDHSDDEKNDTDDDERNGGLVRP